MNSELTNLLPQERCRALRRDYFLRLCVVIFIFLIILTLSAAVLLLPTYIFLTESARSKKAQLSGIESSVSSSDEAILSGQLTTLSRNVTLLEALDNIPSASEVVRGVLTIPRPGITISNFAYSPPAKKDSGKLTVSGKAATRDSLRNYQLAIQNAPFALSADLPVSAYAKDSDISFTITVILAP